MSTIISNDDQETGEADLLTAKRTLPPRVPADDADHLMKAGPGRTRRCSAAHHRLAENVEDAVGGAGAFKATGGKDYIGARGLDRPYAIRTHSANMYGRIAGCACMPGVASAPRLQQVRG